MVLKTFFYVGNRGKATSFYDEKFDNQILGPLKTILKQAGQNVPDWLGKVSEGMYESSAFGGTDFRVSNK